MLTSAGHRNYEFVDKEYVAQGSLTQLFTIQQRSQGTTDINNSNLKETFIPVASLGVNGQMMGRLKIIKPTSRFNGININGKQVTHLGYTNWDRKVFELDLNSLFIDVEYPYGNRRFKMLAIEDYSEMQKFIRYFLTERGYAAQAAASI